MVYERRKRLCMLMPGHWSRVMGGAQFQVKCFVEALAGTGRYEIFFLTRDCLPDYPASGYRLIRYGFPGARSRGIHRHLFEMAVLPQALKRIAPDIIYQRVGCGQTGIAAWYALKNHCKMVWHISSDNDLAASAVSISRLFVYRLLDRQLLNYGIRHAGNIIVQTEDQHALLQKNFKRRAAAIVPNFHPAPAEPLIKQEPVKIVWVANLKELKQPEIFIRLAAELQEIHNAQFIMIGALQGTERLRRKYLKLIEGVRALTYLGPKRQEEVNAILARSHILVNSSRYEGFPNTFIQAWLRQMPVVSLQVNPDRLIDRQGLGFVSGSYEKLKEDVSALISDSELRNRLGMKAQSFAAQYFSTRNAVKIMEIFENPLPLADRCSGGA
jgi:glycosyltransferase involved in cell wall biosynthesis